jgi:hypothetical protein
MVLILGALAAAGVVAGSHSHVATPLNQRRVAAVPFDNHTGRKDLNDLGAMAADWIARGIMETPLFNAGEVEAVYREDSAAMTVRGSYYLSGDSVLFQAAIMDVASGRVLRAFDPVGTPLESVTQALELLRERIAAGLSSVVNVFNRGSPIDPNLTPPANLAAYREFVAGLRQGRFDDWEAESQHYRQAALMDSSFAAPLVQLAFRATLHDQCEVTDSVATVLEPHRDRLSTWNRMTISALRAFCLGNITEGVELLEQRYRAYPRSASAQTHYATALQETNHVRAARDLLERLDPERDMGWRHSPQEVWSRYWWRSAGSQHALGDYRAELGITDRWQDSSAPEWRQVRGRALAGLGDGSEAIALLASTTQAEIDVIAEPMLATANELMAHGHMEAARALAESILVRFAREPVIDGGRAWCLARGNRLLGRVEREGKALAIVVKDHQEPLVRLEAAARLATLRADTVELSRIDSALAEQSDQSLRNPWKRGAEILVRAHIATERGQRERAVALLQEASARGLFDLGPSQVFHADPLLTPLRGYPPFDALLRVDQRPLQ